MRARQGLLIAGAAIAVLGLGTGLIWARETEDATLRPTPPEITYGMVLPEATPEFTMSMMYIERPGTDVTVLSVTPLTSPNVEFLGAFTVWPRDFGAYRIDVTSRYPPKQAKARHPIGELVPAAETAYTTDGGGSEPLAVAAGFRIRSGDLGAVNGIEVIYEAGDEQVREVFEFAVIACVKPRKCYPPEETARDEDWDSDVLRRFGLLSEES